MHTTTNHKGKHKSNHTGKNESKKLIFENPQSIRSRVYLHPLLVKVGLNLDIQSTINTVHHDILSMQLLTCSSQIWSNASQYGFSAAA